MLVLLACCEAFELFVFQSTQEEGHGRQALGTAICHRDHTNRLWIWMERVLWKRRKTGRKLEKCGFFGPSRTLPAGDVNLFDFVACIT